MRSRPERRSPTRGALRPRRSSSATRAATTTAPSRSRTELTSAKRGGLARREGHRARKRLARADRRGARRGAVRRGRRVARQRPTSTNVAYRWLRPVDRGTRARGRALAGRRAACASSAGSRTVDFRGRFPAEPSTSSPRLLTHGAAPPVAAPTTALIQCRHGSSVLAAGLPVLASSPRAVAVSVLAGLRTSSSTWPMRNTAARQRRSVWLLALSSSFTGGCSVSACSR